VAIHSRETPTVIYEYVKNVAYQYKPYGPANFQLRIGTDGIPKLFEINPRFSGTTGTRALFGVNEVEAVVAHLLNLPLPSCEKIYGKVVRYLEEILVESPL
jgi:carbamoyl-phosphate synthase large subunit